MKAIIEWLLQLEHTASSIYSDAALIFQDDPSFYRFLRHSADDEAQHYHIMASACNHLHLIEKETALISIDEVTKKRIEKPFIDCREHLNRGTLTKELLIESLLQVEFSEWNSIFLYVVNSLKVRVREFEYAASCVQHHLKHIKYYLDTHDLGHHLRHILAEVPPVWKERVLIVDDEAAIRDLFKAILQDEYEVYSAEDGEKALEQIEQTHFDLIISDLDMPNMDGIELYKKVQKKIGNEARKRFLFHTGNPRKEALTFFQENKVDYLLKPISIFELRQAVKERVQNFSTT